MTAGAPLAPAQSAEVCPLWALVLAFCRFLRRKEFLQQEKNEKTFFPLSASSVSGEESDGLVPWPGVCPRRVLDHSEDGLGSSECPWAAGVLATEGMVVRAGGAPFRRVCSPCRLPEGWDTSGACASGCTWQARGAGPGVAQTRSNQAFGRTALLGTAPAVLQRGSNRVSQKGNSCCCCGGRMATRAQRWPTLRSVGAGTPGAGWPPGTGAQRLGWCLPAECGVTDEECVSGTGSCEDALGCSYWLLNSNGCRRLVAAHSLLMVPWGLCPCSHFSQEESEVTRAG